MKSYRILCLLLSVVMLLSVVFPISVSADEFELVDEFVVQEDAGEYYDEEIIVEDYSYEPEYQTEDETIVYEEIDTVQDEAVQDEAIQDEAIQPEEIENSEPDAVVMELELVESEAFGTACAIVTQPTDCTVEVGGTATFTVEATGVASWRWQYWNAGNNTWKNCSGTNATFSFTTKESNYNNKYRCKLTGADNSVLYTDEVKLVKPAEFAIVTQPTDCEVKVGGTATFTVEATGVASWQWQYWNAGNNTWRNCSGTNATFSFTTKESNYSNKYRCKLTSADNSVLYTDEVKLVKPAEFAIVTQPTDCEVKVGGTATFTVEATGVASWQWQYAAQSGNTWKNCSGTNATFSFTTKESNYNNKYRCKLTSADNSVLYTDEVKLVKPAEFAIVTQPTDCEVKVGGTATFTVEATGVASWQWQYAAQSGNTWKNCSGTNATFSFTTKESNYNNKYRCKLTSADNSVLYTDEVKLVKPAIVIDGVTYKPLTETTCAAVAYDNDPSRTSLNIPKIVDNKYTVTEIGEANNSKGVFEGCTALTSIDLPNDITVIHARAFKDCTNLSTMTTH